MRNRMPISRTLARIVCLVVYFGSVCMAQSTCATLEKGSVSGHTYLNKVLGIVYTFPQNLASDASVALPRDRNTQILVALWKTPHDLPVPSVVLMRIPTGQRLAICTELRIPRYVITPRPKSCKAANGIFSPESSFTGWTTNSPNLICTMTLRSRAK